MITNAERRFIVYWPQQKSGPRWKYYLLFSLAWTVVCFLVIFFLSKLLTNLWETGGPNFIFILLIISVIMGVLFTHINYTLNEKKYNAILRKTAPNSQNDLGTKSG